MRTPGDGNQQSTGKRGARLRVALGMVLALLVVAGAWCRWVYVQIDHYATTDQAEPSGAIAVFGAAEYDGRPSPVYRARLDHARSLYSRGIAPLVITLGGPGGDGFSEGEVGRQYLIGAGIPEADIIAETKSRSSSESARRLAVIARANHLQRIVIVSDPIHMFRIHAICEADGIDALTSPRERTPTSQRPQSGDTILHEVVTYSLWRLHLD